MKKVIHKCFLCESNYQHGPHIYEGKYARYYGFEVCKTCWDCNWDGWNPFHEDKIIKYMEFKKILLPKRNDKGYFPRDISI